MMTDRIAALEAQITSMQVELAKLKVEQPAPPKVEEEGVRVITLLPEPSDLPNLREMEKLYAAVRGLSPWPEALVDRYDDGRPFRGFSSALRWVQSMPRAERPNGRVAMSYWIDCCKNWLRDRNCMASDLSVNGLVLACFAAGDVCYCPANSQLGVVWEVGIPRIRWQAGKSWRVEARPERRCGCSIAAEFAGEAHAGAVAGAGLWRLSVVSLGAAIVSLGAAAGAPLYRPSCFK